MSADDEPPDEDVFHPLGESWQDDLEDLLEETEYDAELGMEMGRDAMRVTSGDLSEAEFYERYHDDVMAEFGEDERPIAGPDDGDGEDGGIGSTLVDLAGGDESRREMLKKAGAGMGFASLGWGAVEQQEPAQSVEETAGEVEGADEGTQWGMTIDLEHCDGCLACVTACNQEHNWDEGANWMYVLAYEDGEVESPDPGTVDVEPGECSDNPAVQEFNYLVRPCQHCTDAPCEKVCPTTARHTRDDGGLVLTDYEVCIGCRYCQVACPYGVNYFQWDDPNVDRSELDSEGIYDKRGRPVSRRAPRGVMSKCVFDPARQDGNAGEALIGTSACEQACPPNVIQFGDKNNPASDPQRYEANPARARTIINLFAELPSPNSIESALAGVDPTLDAVVEAVDGLTIETIALAKGIELTHTEYDEEAPPGDTLPEKEQTVLDVVSAIEATGLDLESDDALTQLGLTVEGFEGPTQDIEVTSREEVADTLFGDYVDAPESQFELLADIGTNPNVTYLGHQPGPEAHQVPGPVSYADVGMLDRRQEALDEQTVGLDFS
ncbi:4Fe-4S ferredoxin N-terminal domain-containing protein [Natrinema pallidum]|uniref:4Fe-4S ferredoxin iron-sulfur binding domain protein n=2 Tax=Natrinema pallidum TaxID=69527 RepID=L9Z1E0_9EURY|nr:4Fe-4S ferredoxin N-terminal domain-containing protein [Natrinema pallidum]ELY80330.1 4Fe-4S ferredoxin iron-sulfur binding domain protein [Natrinema pallidum DSM 3751]QCW02411.1 4Fe-4S dicluster domain-containing protein [Natrinema pallidum]